ncbi:MAG: hypothetical protein IJX99_02315 [Clostridia bacterium]|nr:hypothetical protein [Clostridia bacterium]
MKSIFMRCLLCFTVTVILFSATLCPAKAITVVEKRSNPWNQAWIYPEDDIVTPNIVIIYLHGDGNNGGSNINDLWVMSKVNHPLKYAKENTLQMTDEVLIICPQSRGNAQFRKQQKDLSNVIKDIHDKFPDALLLLAGHSNGAIAAYKVAIAENPYLDGYVFISGNKPAESSKLQFTKNCFVAYGENDSIHRRSDFSNLFDLDISKSKYAKRCQVTDGITKNAYMVGNWSHGQAPLVFLEDFFWEWVYELALEKGV